MKSAFRIRDLEIAGAKLIEPFCVEDERGYFAKYFESGFFHSCGIDFHVDEEFESKSQKGVLRGLHCQFHKPQDKLVHVTLGAVKDVLVDLRKESPTYKKWIMIDLTEENHYGLFVPKGCAHGFKVISDVAIMVYMCAGRYDPASDGGIRWDDPDIAINWEINGQNIIISEKDKNLLPFREFEKKGFLYE